MKRKLRILFLPKWFPNKVLPNNGNFIEVHAKAISLYADVFILFVTAADQDKRFELEISEEPSILTVKVYFKNPKGLMRWVYPFRYIKAQLMGYNEILKKAGEPDMTHVHVLLRNSFFAFYLKLKEGLPYLISEHWSGYSLREKQSNSIILKFFRWLIVRNSSGITTVSKFLRDAMIDNGIKAEYSIIPNAVDTSIFNNENRKDKAADSLKLLHISNLEEKVKNVGGILNAFQAILSSSPQLELHIIGDGKDRPKQERKISELGLQEKVFLHGDVPRAEVAKLLREAAALIIFSKVETQSVVMLEALCCGTPVIAAAVGGIPEHLNAERGILLLNADEKELSNSILHLLGKSAIFDPEAISSYGIKHFSYQEVGSQFYDLYHRVLQIESNT